MTSLFDPELFMSQQTDDANSTVFTPVPEGEYTGVILRRDSEEHEDEERRAPYPQRQV